MRPDPAAGGGRNRAQAPPPRQDQSGPGQEELEREEEERAARRRCRRRGLDQEALVEGHRPQRAQPDHQRGRIGLGQVRVLERLRPGQDQDLPASGRDGERARPPAVPGHRQPAGPGEGQRRAPPREPQVCEQPVRGQPVRDPRLRAGLELHPKRPGQGRLGPAADRDDHRRAPARLGHEGGDLVAHQRGGRRRHQHHRGALDGRLARAAPDHRRARRSQELAGRRQAAGTEVAAGRRRRDLGAALVRLPQHHRRDEQRQRGEHGHGNAPARHRLASAPSARAARSAAAASAAPAGAPP